MKKILVLLFAVITFNGSAQDYFDVDFKRDATPSLLNSENDSLFSDQAEIKIFEDNSVSSIQVKYYTFSDSTFTEVYNTTTSESSVTGTPCNSTYCLYKTNPSVILINLGSHSALDNKRKVYIKVNGVTGKGNVIKEVEL